jgi:homocitrate synthase NifV
LLKDTRTYQSLDPRLFGRSNRIVIGKHSGLSAITSLLAELKVPVSAEQARGILARVRQHAVANKGPVARETVMAIWREVSEQSLASCA